MNEINTTKSIFIGHVSYFRGVSYGDPKSSLDFCDMFGDFDNFGGDFDFDDDGRLTCPSKEDIPPLCLQQSKPPDWPS